MEVGKQGRIIRVIHGGHNTHNIYFISSHVIFCVLRIHKYLINNRYIVFASCQIDLLQNALTDIKGLHLNNLREGGTGITTQRDRKNNTSYREIH